MDPICTATTSSGKKCTRCVEKHGVKYCWQHSKTPKKMSPKKASPKRGSPKKMSPKGPAYLATLPKDVLIQHVLLKLKPSELNSMCRTDERILTICRDPNFQKMYKERHIIGKMFVGKLSKPTEIDPRKILGHHTLVDDEKNRLEIQVSRRRRGPPIVVEVVTYIPHRQDYGYGVPGDAWEPLQIQAIKSEKGWKGYIGRFDTEYGTVYQGAGYMEEIQNFFISIGVPKWGEGLKLAQTPEGFDIFVMKSANTKEFLLRMQKEIDKLYP